VSRRAVLLLLFAIIFASTCTYRFLTMGGRFGGFDDDEFVVASYSQQLMLGDRPTRDFIEPGRPLQHLLGAAAQKWLGRTLFSQFAVSVVMIALATAILFLLAERASGSITIALAVALIQIALAPRYYNYPKLLSYVVAIPAIWWYIDRPNRGRLFLIGAVGAFAFLLRHDHGAYVAVAGVAAVVGTHWPDWRKALRETAILGLMALILVAPYLIYTQGHESVFQYVRASIAFGERSVGRTELHRLPRFSVDLSRPLMEKSSIAPVATPRINVHWRSGLDERTRTAREEALGLSPDNPVAPDVWNYKLEDASPSRLGAVLADPLVIATEGIDRATMTVVLPQPSRRARVLAAINGTQLLPGVITEHNAIAFLYYLLILPPMVALLLLVGRPASDVRAPRTHPRLKIAVVAILALVMMAGLLRGNVGARVADVSESSAIIIAWLMGLWLARHSRGARIAAFIGAGALFVMTAASVQAIEHVTALIAQTGIDKGRYGVASHAREVYRSMTAVPPVAAWDRREKGIVGLAAYVHACTQPEDRVVVLGYVPQLFFLSHRGFGAGSPWILPDYFTSETDQQRMIARIEAHRVPLVFTVPEPDYTDDYAAQFSLLDAFLRREYREIGVLHSGTTDALRVLVRRTVTPLRSDPVLDLPCFAG
jgi:hypothetical protein